MREGYRKLFHTTFGAIIAIGVLVLGRSDGLIALFALLAAGLAMIHWKLSGFEQKIVDFFLEKMERQVPMPGLGALMFVIGALLALSFAKNSTAAVSVLLILSFGDGASTLVGMHGRHHLFYNRHKTWEGAAAFFLASFAAALPLLGLAAAWYALALAVVETLPIPFDDNLTIPFIGAALSYLL